MAATTTAASLLGLVSHLRSMESAFVGVLLESALKLSNVTDAKIFILVETSDGRQWAGNRHLKEEFLNSGIHPCPGDVECTVDPSSAADAEQLVRGKPYLPFPTELDALFPRRQPSTMMTTKSAKESQRVDPSNDDDDDDDGGSINKVSSPSPTAVPTSSSCVDVASDAESTQRRWRRAGKRASSPNGVDEEGTEDGTPRSSKVSRPNERPFASPRRSASFGDDDVDGVSVSIFEEDVVVIKEEQLEQYHESSGDFKNECDSTRNEDDEDEDGGNHRCAVIDSKPVSLNASHGSDGGDGGQLPPDRRDSSSSNNSMDFSLMNSRGFHYGVASSSSPGGGGGRYPPAAAVGGPAGNQLASIAQSFNNNHAAAAAAHAAAAAAWASTGSMDSSNRNNRTQFSDEQIAMLKTYYDEDKYVNATRAAAIAADIGVYARVVNVWFQNTRAKEKRSMKSETDNEKS